MCLIKECICWWKESWSNVVCSSTWYQQHFQP